MIPHIDRKMNLNDSKGPNSSSIPVSVRLDFPSDFDRADRSSPDPWLSSVVTRLLPLATYYTSIHAFVEQYSLLEHGVINHALCSAIRDMLRVRPRPFIPPRCLLTMSHSTGIPRSSRPTRASIPHFPPIHPAAIMVSPPPNSPHPLPPPHSHLGTSSPQRRYLT